MLKTKIILPSGRVLSSGTVGEPAILSAKLTQSVNDTQELSLGAVCAGMLDVQILDPLGELSLTAGQELQVYKVAQDGGETLLGLFTTEVPRRTGAHAWRITAYDRVAKLDRDVSGWLNALEGWPYSLLTFAKLAARECGLTLVNTAIPNGDYQVKAFTAQGVTGRQLLRWAAEAAGRFCRATPEGNLEFAWYGPAPRGLTTADYFQGGVSREDYQTAPIEKVQIRLTEADNGVVWPDEAGEKNTYILQGNYLLTATEPDTLVPVAQTLYGLLKEFTYTPARVKLPASLDLQPGQILQVTDRNGNAFQTLVMTKTQSGQGDTLQSTGSSQRNSTTARNNEDYRARNARLLELQKNAEGLLIRVSEQTQDIQAVRQSVADLQLKADSLQLRLTEFSTATNEAIQAVGDGVQNLQKEMSAKATPEGVDLQIRTAMEQGAEKVITSTGFRFDSGGMTVEKSGSEMKTQITEDGMAVYRSGQKVLTADNQGVDAKNLHATTYLIVGKQSRFEDYGSGRTGCFWIGG